MSSTDHPPEYPNSTARHFFRFHRPHAHLSAVFGNDWFALKAEVSNPVCLSGAQKRFC